MDFAIAIFPSFIIFLFLPKKIKKIGKLVWKNFEELCIRESIVISG